jgi:phospholipase A1
MSATMNRIFLICLLSCLAVASWAQEPKPLSPQEAIDACRVLESTEERLACYDAIPGATVTGGPVELMEPPQTNDSGDRPSRPGLFAVRHETPLQRSRMTRRWELDDTTHGGRFRVRRHNPVYALPARYSTRPNEQPESSTLGPAPSRSLDSIEAKFQISLKTKLADNLLGDNGDVWVGFTQQSNWQAYDDDDSEPFRETNYSPEIWTSWRTGLDLGVMRWQMVNLGFVHQSNGQSDPLSRSWNRIYATLGFERGDWELFVRPWLRVEAPGPDDNPNIEKFLGHGDVRLVWRGARHDVGITGRWAAGHSRGALQFDWHYPLIGDLKAYLQIFTGYGESLIDYNHRQTTIGLGVSLVQ